MAKNAVQKIDEENKLPVAADMAMFADDVGSGATDFNADDFTIPRMNIIQALSPQRQKTNEKFVEGAEEGMIYIRPKALISGNDGVLVIPCKYQPTYLAWAPKDKGGGLAANYGSDASHYNAIDPIKDGKDKGKRFDKDGNLHSRTAEYYVLLVDANGQTKKAVMSLANTGLKHARDWNTTIAESVVVDREGQAMKDAQGQAVKAAIFFWAYRLKTMPVQKGDNSWFRWDIAKETPTAYLDNGSAIYAEAKSFRAAIEAGTVKAADVVDDEPAERVVHTDEDPM